MAKKRKLELDSGLVVHSTGDGGWKVTQKDCDFEWYLPEDEARELVKFLEKYVINSDDQEIEENLEERVGLLETRQERIVDLLSAAAGNLNSALDEFADEETL